MRIVISSGHGKYIRGAAGYIDEVDEARKVVNYTAEVLQGLGIETTIYHDDVSHSQNENLTRIVDFHNSKSRDLDISVHFNAYQTTSKPMGCEVLYKSQTGLTYADKTVDRMCLVSGLVNRGPKERNDLYFLNYTEMPAILIETCFVDSQADVDIYHKKFEDLCQAIAEAVSGKLVGGEPEAPSEPEMTQEEKAVVEMASKSEIASYSWRDRGKAPAGYIKGFALTWANVVHRWIVEDPISSEMAKAAGDPDLDALAWFREEFSALGMSNDIEGLNTLRHLFVLLMGLGMRESSGRHCEGRDQSASNVSADTAEAGLYQTSYNAHTCCSEFDTLMADYENDLYDPYLDVFKEGVECSQGDWQSYGTGRGYDFQEMCKSMPAFAVETAALVLRNRRQHYGPINRKEVELRPEADYLLTNIQRMITAEV